MRRIPRRTRPSGFTLVELLVVMVIIAILSALLIPAITGAMRTAKNASVTGEINTLSQALASFKEKYGDYPPSRILLCENGHYPATLLTTSMVSSGNGSRGADISMAALGQRSMSYLRKFWPRMVLSTTTTPVWATGSTQWYDFDGNGVMSPWPYILEGDECLTFFLGGVPLNTGTSAEPVWSMSGWGKSPTNPFFNNLANNNSMYSGNRVAPFFEFKNDRLRDTDDPTQDGVSAAKGGVRFPSYYDLLVTDSPFAYFSAYGSEGYDPNDVNFAPRDSTGDPTGAEKDDVGTMPALRHFIVPFPITDSGSISRLAKSAAPNPYHISKTGAANTQWHKGQTFQIISPGADGLYGLGGVYRPEDPTKMPADMATVQDATDNTIRNRENDNLTNFAGGPLD